VVQRMSRLLIAGTLFGAVCSVGNPIAASEPTIDELVDLAKQALAEGQAGQAIELADQAIELSSDAKAAWTVRALANEQVRQFAAALKDWDRVIELDAEDSVAYDRRGSVHFKLAEIDESIADFDRSIELRPETEAGHWRRGIAYYYAKRFEEGRRQFEAYQTVDDNDVENAVWQYLCIAAEDGPEEAREKMMHVGFDRRVPLMVVDAMFRGKAEPQDVLNAANAGEVDDAERKLRLFYAHLYLGLYHEAQGDAAASAKHMEMAVETYNVGGYMWEVARVHRIVRDRENAQ